MTKIVSIRTIRQVSNHSFSILWSDDCEQIFELSELQRRCPCAQCHDEFTGTSLVHTGMINDNVRAIKIHNVGRYAIRIQFNSGCSLGIYSFDFLKNMK